MYGIYLQWTISPWHVHTDELSIPYPTTRSVKQSTSMILMNMNKFMTQGAESILPLTATKKGYFILPIVKTITQPPVTELYLRRIPYVNLNTVKGKKIDELVYEPLIQ